MHPHEKAIIETYVARPEKREKLVRTGGLCQGNLWHELEMALHPRCVVRFRPEFRQWGRLGALLREHTIEPQAFVVGGEYEGVDLEREAAIKFAESLYGHCGSLVSFDGGSLVLYEDEYVPRLLVRDTRLRETLKQTIDEFDEECERERDKTRRHPRRRRK